MSLNQIGILKTISGEIERLAETAGRSVVSIGASRGAGSGIVWDEHTVVTASHVVRGADEVSLGTSDGKKLTAKVAGRLRRADIAVLKTDATLVPIARGDSDKLKVGQFVLALANPFSSQVSVTSGIITSASRSIGGWGMSIENAVVTDARVNPGYSGGPLVDASGQLIGMNVAYFSKRGIAVPVNAISRAVQRLAAGKTFKRAYLGIVTNPVELPAEVATDKRVSQEAGLMVFSVEDGTPAKKAGLTLGDVILKLNGKGTESTEDLTSFLSEEAIGRPAKILLLRGGNVTELTVTPAEGQEE